MSRIKKITNMINKRDWTIVEKVLVRGTIPDLIFKSNHIFGDLSSFGITSPDATLFVKKKKRKYGKCIYFPDILVHVFIFYKEQTTSETHREKQTINVPFNHYHDLRHN